MNPIELKTFRNKFNYFGGWDKSNKFKWLDGTKMKRALEKFIGEMLDDRELAVINKLRTDWRIEGLTEDKIDDLLKGLS